MRITHKYKNEKITKKVNEDVGLILGNDLGNYFYLTNGNETRYQGFFYADGDNYKNELIVYKIIDRINILNNSNLTEVENRFFTIKRKYDNSLEEKYFMPNGYNSLCLETNKKTNAEIILDMRHPYDSRQMGRIYDVEVKRDYALIKFTKHRDLNEDGMDGKKEFSLCLAIKTDRYDYRKTGEFFSKYYKKDEERNSYPWNRFVFRALEIEFKEAVFSVAKTPQKALAEANYVFDNLKKLRKETERETCKRIKSINVSDEEINMAYLCAKNSIYNLLVENNNKRGAYAGLPWFFQFWHRDEAISLLQIYKINPLLSKEIIIAQLKSISEEGQLPKSRSYENRQKEVLSADALGWLADRILKIDKWFKVEGDLKSDIAKEFERAVSLLSRNKSKEDLAINSKNETWMDSLERSGARIEIQAGRLKIYELLYKFTKNDQYKILKEDLKKRTRESFYKNEILQDGPEDETIRPNIFLTAYLYPGLLNNKEWENCFDKILPKLYLNWGGLSSVDITSNKFISADTGENSASYHNGNSWYWINNLVAIVLYKLNPHKYMKYINSIMEASTDEILYHGIIGHYSEVSSAKKQTFAGCNVQLWSAAMYLEVIDEIRKKQ